MPFLSIALLALNAFCVVHAARSGRFWPWAWVVLFLPVVGAAAYLLMEFLPAWHASPNGQRMVSGVAKAVDREKTYRLLKDELDTVDTIANRVALAKECEALGRFGEAVTLLDGVVSSPLGHEATFHIDRARMLLAAGCAEAAIAGLEWVKAEWPNESSPIGHLTYARALVACGRMAEAEDEYRALTQYFVGPEPGVELARLYKSQGRAADAKAVAADYARRIERSPDFAKRMHKDSLRELKQLARG